MSLETTPTSSGRYSVLKNYLDRKYGSSEPEGIYNNEGDLIKRNTKYCCGRIILVKEGNKRRLILTDGIKKGLRRKLKEMVRGKAKWQV